MPPEGIHTFNSRPVLIKYLPPRDSLQMAAGDASSAFFDPWAAAAQLKTANASANATSTANVPGPTEARFQEHANKLNEQETKLQQIEHALTKLQKDTQHEFQQVQVREQQAQAQVQQAIMTVKNELDNSFQKGIQQQSVQLNSTLGELRSLLQAPPKRSRSPAEEEMEDWHTPETKKALQDVPFTNLGVCTVVQILSAIAFFLDLRDNVQFRVMDHNLYSGGEHLGNRSSSSKTHKKSFLLIAASVEKYPYAVVGICSFHAIFLAWLGTVSLACVYHNPDCKGYSEIQEPPPACVHKGAKSCYAICAGDCQCVVFQMPLSADQRVGVMPIHFAKVAFLRCPNKASQPSLADLHARALPIQRAILASETRFPSTKTSKLGKIDTCPSFLRKPVKKCFHFDAYRGERVGEAKNPGPKHKKMSIHQQQAVFAIINPTAIRNKDSEFGDLMQTYQVDTFCCAETTATKDVQQQMTKQFTKLGLKTVWSDPVPLQRNKTDMQPSLRGRVGGTSIHSKWPIGYSQQHKPHAAADRLTHAVIQIGSLYIQVVTFYGYTGGNTWHKQATNDLFACAIRMAEGINLPALFVGDFNMDVQNLEMFDFLAAKGYMSLQQTHEQMYQKPMPNTCKEATCPDTAIVHPQLLPLIKHVCVDKHGLFDAHDPVIVVFQVPTADVFQRRLKMPKTWAELPITADDLEHAAQSMPLSQPQTLQEWAELVEDVVDFAIQHDHAITPHLQPLHGLPKKNSRALCGT